MAINNALFTPFPALETPRLLLRQLTLEYAPYVMQVRSNPQVMEFMDSLWHTSIQDSEQFIQKNLDRYAAKEGLYWVLIEKESQQPIGDFAFWKIDQQHHRSEIGYLLHPSFWGKGYMKEAMAAIIDFAFTQLGVHSLEANINPLNNASRQMLLKMGFEKEAYFRESYFYSGKYLDSEIYCLVNNR